VARQVSPGFGSSPIPRAVSLTECKRSLRRDISPPPPARAAARQGLIAACQALIAARQGLIAARQGRNGQLFDFDGGGGIKGVGRFRQSVELLAMCDVNIRETQIFTTIVEGGKAGPGNKTWQTAIKNAHILIFSLCEPRKS
jgi:hypothetical protein